MAKNREGFRVEMDAARAEAARGDHAAAFARLERAHILGQLCFFDHVVSHIWMLRVAWARRDGRELRGQVLRLAATVPGHLFGWLPIGNTGGADVSPLKPMPIPTDLQGYFEGFSLKRQVLRQTLILGVAGAAVVAWIAA